MKALGAESISFFFQNAMEFSSSHFQDWSEIRKVVQDWPVGQKKIF
jgi:hypothetical protein